MRFILTVLFRRKVIIVFLAIAVFGAVVAATLLTPKQYESQMKILLKNERADPLIGPNKNDLSSVPLEVTENQVNSEIELLTSNSIMEQVASKCSLNRFEHVTNNDPRTAVERAARRLRRDLKITPVRKASVIQISYISANPARSADVLRVLSDFYLNAHLSARSVAGTREFFESEAEKHRKTLLDTEDRLSEFRKDRKVVLIGEQKDLMVRNVVDTQKALDDANAALAENTSRVSDLKGQISAMGSRIVTQRRVVPNQYSVERLHTMLAELNNRRSDLLMKFKSDDRLVEDLDTQIRDTTAAMDRATKLTAVEESTDVNPLRQSLSGELAQAQTTHAGLTAKRDVLQADLHRQQTQLTQLDSATAQNEDLQRAVKEAEDKYLLYAHKQEETRIADLLDQRKIADAIIAEQPLESHLPVKPNVPLNLLLGALLAAFASIGTALGLEYSGNVFYTPGELESALGIPVLATSPLEAM